MSDITAPITRAQLIALIGRPIKFFAQRGREEQRIVNCRIVDVGDTYVFFKERDSGIPIDSVMLSWISRIEWQDCTRYYIGQAIEGDDAILAPPA